MHQTFSELEDTGDEVPPDGPVDLEELERDLPPLLPIVKVSLLPPITLGFVTPENGHQSQK